MSRKKKLKVNGSEITNHSVQVMQKKSRHTEDMVDFIHLNVTAGQDFSYEIYSDERHPSLDTICSFIDATLSEARQSYRNVEITEYTERNYLFYKVQKEEQMQYTGVRV